MGIAKWLGWEDDDVSSGARKKKKPRKIVEHRGVRTMYKGKEVVRGKSRRGRRDKDLPSVCTDDFTGDVKTRGKTIRYINGVRQKGK